MLLASTCLAQSTLITNKIYIENHGGYGLFINIGADKGDVITLDIKCDHTVNGQCLIEAPKLYSGEIFTSIKCPTCGSGHQLWKVKSPSTGDQFVTAQYLWVGVGVHYWIKIIATENL